jgi:RNA polymerase sigma factor (sigma-70 family)
MNKYTELLIRCHKADAQAQRSLYDLFKSRLFGLCRRYTRNREEAQDVMQDAFIKIFKHIGEVASDEKLESWMKSVTVNTAINHYHRTKRLDQVIPLELSECDQLTEDHLSHLTDQLLISMVNELPEGCRIVFNMFVVEGYSHSEIAALLHISDSTSRSQLHHAKALMKEKLKCQDMAQYYEKFA